MTGSADHASVAGHESNLAASLVFAGDDDLIAEASALADRALASRSRALGRNHQLTTKPRLVRCLVLMRKGLMKQRDGEPGAETLFLEAEAETRDILEIRRVLAVDLAFPLQRRAEALACLRRDDALPVFAEAEEYARTKGLVVPRSLVESHVWALRRLGFAGEANALAEQHGIDQSCRPSFFPAAQAQPTGPALDRHN
jgi:hypothetical protein